MASGRKPIHLEMQGTKGNRQRIWEAIRANSESFTAFAIAHYSNVDDTTVRSYLQALIKGAYVEIVSGEKFEVQTLRLINDIGVEAPAVTRKGELSTAGRGTEAMWRTLRILGELDASELAQQASIVAPITVQTARSYLKWLKAAGYLIEVSAGKPGTLARYLLPASKYSGPRPPMIQRVGQVFDPNLGEVVFSQPPKADAL